MAFNSCTFLGRLVRDPDVRHTQSNKAVTSFKIAVDRYGKETDFIPCAAWEKTGELIKKHFKKGNLILVDGKMHSRNYEDRDGNKRSSLECCVTEVSFVGERKNDDVGEEPESEGSYEELPEDSDDLPF